MLIMLLLLAAVFLAYVNGANDNFKGVATLYGSGTLNYKTAITIATLATFAGSLGAIYISQGLIASFSGKGLVPQDIAGATHFLIAVGFAAACTVLLATRLGFPISTTHSLVGALVGAGIMAVGNKVDVSNMLNAFFLPLLISPFIAFALGAALYYCFTHGRKRLNLTKESCLCIGERKQAIALGVNANQVSSMGLTPTNHINAHTYRTLSPQLTLANQATCSDVYTGKVWGVNLQRVLDAGHIISAAAVSFARGLNDTPKIAGLLVAAQAINITLGMVVIALGMALGGLLNAHRVAKTISKDITVINHGQGFSANIVTSFLVIVASKFGVPVSTTHVSVGSIFGIGIVSKQHNRGVIRNIILSWLITLPVAMLLSAAIFYLLA